MKPTNESVKAFILEVLSSGKMMVGKLEWEVEESFAVIQEPLLPYQFENCYAELIHEGKICDESQHGQPSSASGPCWIAPQKPVPQKPARNLFE